MDVKFVVLFVSLMLATVPAKSGVVFNFHEKIREATSTTTENNVDASQIIRVPNLECPIGFRRDDLGHCREKL